MERVDPFDVELVLTMLGDIRNDVRRIRKEIVDDDGEEEEQADS
jgi:hypothetical protein